MGLLEKRVDTRRRVPVDKMRHFSSFLTSAMGKIKKMLIYASQKERKR